MLGGKALPGMALSVQFRRIDPLTNGLKVREAREGGNPWRKATRP